jgi:hypothetical protein
MKGVWQSSRYDSWVVDFLVEASGWSLAGAQVIKRIYGTDVFIEYKKTC